VQSGEAHTRGLGAELKAETQRVTQLLFQTPLIGEIVGGPFRRFASRRFPFALIYRIDGDRLRILAVAHRRRHPGYWSERK
jgi:plasmid stabilization system protein ParE